MTVLKWDFTFIFHLLEVEHEEVTCKILQSSFSRPGDRSILHLPDILQDDLPGDCAGLPTRALPSTRPPFSIRPRLLLQTGKPPEINQRLGGPIHSP
jgi:hypothetical protein